MKLKRLLKTIPGIEVRGSKEIEITGVTSNSKTVVPGNLFIAKKGLSSDGSQFIEEAIATGAAAVLTDMYNPFLSKTVVQLITKDVAALEAVIANIFYEDPSKHLFTVGVTGTSGKTTTTYMIRHLLQELIGMTGLIGTVEWIVADQYLPSNMTTPEIITTLKLMREMRGVGCKACVMEVSSHALTQRRVTGIDYDVAVFTNLSQDHLDYHKDMQSYAQAKALLFASLQDSSKTAVINLDSPWGVMMFAQSAASRKITYGIENEADLMAEGIVMGHESTEFYVVYKAKKYLFITSMIGRFNVYNLLASIAVGLAKGFLMPDIIQALGSFSDVPGRLQKVPNDRGLHIFVDYSHKPDALENVLLTLQALKKGRLICLFGCGGNRDQGKRALMGSIAERLADRVILTSDNPRSEDPLEIIRQIIQGVADASAVTVEPDRRLAIHNAVQDMRRDDILLIAGKGHETYQLFGRHQVEFDDRCVAQDSCK
ncbi:MAG: UDP-N-acetylmuramoyl-L-alanyl-D-glutamate--2,6-diaminopimelate ligase [Chlamydiae bacterium]|nr:UDP-N-acetylmuramoyl-L-alanyl-D-glutamate--2,6-diaminopimelate ligase [Chlamydiota bacterium]